MTYFYTLLSLLVLDSIWLFSTASIYKEWFSHAFILSPQLFPAVIFYPLYALGIYVLILRPTLSMKRGWKHVAVSGALFGLSAYGAYDLTNQATIQGRSWVTTIIDMGWGISLTALASLIAWKFSKK